MKPGTALAWRAVSGLAAAAVLAASGWLGYDRLARRPIAAVRFGGELARVPADDLERLAEGLRGREARDVSLQAVREAVKHLPWVRECSVRRTFPDALEVTIESQVPLARWDESRLVSVRGELFAGDYEKALPRFVGPEGTAAEMAAAWRGIHDAAAPLGSAVTELRLSQRRAWQAKLASGLVIDLGRADIDSRIARFAAAWPGISAEAAGAIHADLRYPNGFALRGTATGEPKKAQKGPRA